MTRHRHVERPHIIDYTITLRGKGSREVWGDGDDVEEKFMWAVNGAELRSELLGNKAALISVVVDLVEEKGGTV